MAKADLIRFAQLLNTDAGFQEKLRKAAENYNGEKDEKSVFENVLLPLGKEHGLSASYEEFSSFMKSLNSSEAELSDDELEQVAGGKMKVNGAGAGYIECASIGFGFGGGIGMTGGGACFGVGWGNSNVACALAGETEKFS